MKKQIATHNKSMHADEIVAVALLNIFTDDEIVVSRVDHNTTDFSPYDMIIDISKKFDGVKYFDHHQYKGGKSSAGLIWQYLKLEKQYPKISKFIKIIDDNDTGVSKSGEFEFSSLLKAFNEDIYNNELQDIQFKKAVDFAITVINSMRKSQNELLEAKDIVNNSFNFDSKKHIIELETFTPHWTTYINGIVTPHIKAVVWEDENENNYKVKIVSKKLGSFEIVTKPFTQDDSMEFVHSAGYFAIAKDEATMKSFLNKQIK